MRHISTRHDNYIRCALTNIVIAKRKAGRLFSHSNINKTKKIKPLHQWLLRRYTRNYAVVSDCMDTSIVMTAFCLEAFINFYAVHYGIDTMVGYNERIPTLKKWKQYPKILTGSTMSQDSINRLEMIFKARNQLAHYKSRTTDAAYSYSLRNAIEIVNCVPIIFKDLATMQSDVNSTIEYCIEVPEYADNIVLSQGQFCLRE